MNSVDVLYDEIISTEIISDDVFQDRFELPPGEFEEISGQDLGELWSANPEIYYILKSSTDIEEARERLFSYLERQERRVFEIENDLHPLEKANIRECIRTFKSIIGPINEKRTKTSSLKYLYQLAQRTNGEAKFSLEISRGFILEFIHLFKGVVGLSGIYSQSGICKKAIPNFLKMSGREAAQLRSDELDKTVVEISKYLNRYPDGLNEEIVKERQKNKKRILKYFRIGEKQWQDYRWHLRNVIRDVKTLADLIELTEEEKNAITVARQARVPFGITPYYVSLMDFSPSRKRDHQVRAQVIPPMDYVLSINKHKHDRHESLDFMGEHDTSPVDLVTRRYPFIAILKPHNTCAQICVYCQRNWEINDLLFKGAYAGKKRIEKALEWFRDHPGIEDVLITGGDPAVLSDKKLETIFSYLADLPHIRRIRLGTRTPVVLPFRFTEEFVNLLGQFHVPGKREIAIVTHFEHVWEITPEAVEAITRIKRKGINIYNQSVFTVENSRRFEMAALRRLLKITGVDPYYNFNTKGKDETRDYRVPIARILQERKEEARLLPGLDRTDESVFNVPKLGKNHLRSWQDHRVIMILPDGRRVYEFHSWEKNLKPIPPYNHIDVAIWDYLKMLRKRGENIHDYRSIWYYY